MTDENVFSNFPVNGILPKKETGALSFLQKYPNYDGRNTIIAILDTGVDPGAPGLKITSESKPKILDLIDATGNGDVDISTVRSADSNGEVTGLSGRKLKIPSSWKNPSGRWHLGMKDLFELCSSTLRDRLKKERKESLWQPANDEAIFNAQASLNELAHSKDAKTDNATPDSTTKPLDGASSDVASPSSDQKDSSKAAADLKDLLTTLKKEDLQAQLEVIKDLENKIKDVGPVYDCIVWNDGDKWRACVDTSENGNLESCKVLTNFKDSHEYGTFTYQAMLNYSIRILPDENVLQIVTDSTSHGTHVASIAAGYFPDKPELNGVAPGAQIISIKIGDNRINGMETSYAIVNACRFVAEYKCDLVNYSFGEPVHYSHIGPALTAIQELVTRYGVIYCVSAGNNGPGIETVGAPGGSLPEVVSVGAYVTPDMIRVEHSLLGNPASGMLFTWSSRGPQLDGQWGVSVCAPGGAFAAVPNWTQRGTQLMSGTSMASPNCCGCISLILSGLKDQGVETTPYFVKRAIENTAQPIEETVGGGAGLVQVERAFDYLLSYKDSTLQRVHFDIKCQLNSVNFRGLYLKDHDQINETRDYQITIEPKFFENWSRSPIVDQSFDKDETLLRTQQEKISLNRRLGLIWENEERGGGSNWLESPTYFYLVNNSKQIPIRIRANELEEGKAYFTYVKAVDLEDPKKPCLFKIPITVVKPHLFDKKNNSNGQVEFKNVSFKQGQIYRHFIRAPVGATHAEITLKCDELGNESKDHSPLFYVQTFTLGSFRTVSDSVNEEAYRLNNSNEFKHTCKVQSNKVLQISIAKNWSNIGHILANYTIKFRGLYPKNSHEVFCLNGQPSKLEVSSFLNNEDCELTISYKHHIQPLRPVENQIEIVKPTIGRIKPVYQIVLTYHFHQIKTDEVGFEVPLLSHQLYENEFQSIFWMVYETNSKRYIFSGDAFPIAYKYAKSLEKGDYTVRLFIRHEKMESLEKLKETSLFLRRSLSASLSQDVYVSYGALLKNSGKKTSPERIQRGAERVFYLNTIAEDKLPKGIAVGHFLSGELSFFKDAAISKVDKHRIIYQINTHGSASNKKQQQQTSGQSASTAAAAAGKEKKANEDTVSSTSTAASAASKADENKLRDAIRDVQVAHLLKSNDLFDTLIKDHPEHIPIYINRIQYLENQLTSSDNEKKLSIYEEIIGLSGLALNKINQTELLKYLGEKHHDPAQEEHKKDFEHQKSWVIELLVHQGLALIEKQLLQQEAASEKSDSKTIRSIKLNEELRQVYRGLQKWLDLNDDKVSKFMIKFYMHQRYYGKCLKLLFKQLEEKGASKSIDQSILNILNEMNLKHARKFLTNGLIMKYPARFISF